MVDEQARARIEGINELLKDQPYRLELVNPNDVKLLKKNARFMDKKCFQNLVDNISKDGGVSSTPFCCENEDGSYTVLSGNHRIMAARDAGIQEVLIMVSRKRLSKNEKIAIELSHNALVGKDDMATLKEIWEEIDDIGAKYYAGLDDKTLDEMKKIGLSAIAEVALEYRNISFMFLPSEAERLKSTLEDIAKSASAAEMLLARQEDFDRMINANTKIQQAYNIRNGAVSVMKLLDIFYRHQEDLAEGWERDEAKRVQWIPISSILGEDCLPIEEAKVFNRTVQLMMDSGKLKKKEKHKAILLLCEQYLGEKNDKANGKQ